MRTETAVNHFLDSCLARDLSSQTVVSYRSVLRKFAGACPELPKEPWQIDAFLASLRCPWDNTKPVDWETKRTYFAVLRAFFKFTARRSKTPNPIPKVTPPRPKKKLRATLEPEEEMRLLNSTSSLRDRGILTLFVDSGVRTGELIGLRRQDIKAETVRVWGKSGEREVPISEETRRLLLVIAEDSRDEYVFHGRKGRLTRHGVYRVVRIHMRKAGIEGPKLGAHRIRHAFGKGYLVNGGDLRSLQQIMGHANISTTQKYAELSLTDVISKHHKFTPLRAAHAAAQESFLDKYEILEEAKEILEGNST